MISWMSLVTVNGLSCCERDPEQSSGYERLRVSREGKGEWRRKDFIKGAVGVLCPHCPTPLFWHRFFQLIAKLHFPINHDNDVKPDLTEHLVPCWTFRICRTCLGASLPAWPPSPSTLRGMQPRLRESGRGSPHLYVWTLWTLEASLQQLWTSPRSVDSIH
jgi:hypothetical protein